ncbi:hypothetical protein HYH03_017853 [Edaphochlamys debaryana]|uniref:Uncharacterized protein n=1 Tax=Edaphochlamys debaryana TaxID=47281 RepID=A0A835XH55_9CHLO|nr:hypothetical protein HYH03_017853 [Edaphochlamys debaryana]|eukprot:KAG2483255.1 hypothetical protein HYH03_017853 [Edaphochlamys debaryana]
MDEIVAALAGMTAARELEISALSNYAKPFTPAEARELLDAVPPSLTSLRLCGIGTEPSDLFFRYSGGLFDTVFSNASGPYSEVASFLAIVVLPSRALGPRLSLLTLFGLDVEALAPDPGPAAGLLARCAKVELHTLRLAAGGSAAAALMLISKLGLPQSVEWTGPVCFPPLALSSYNAAPCRPLWRWRQRPGDWRQRPAAAVAGRAVEMGAAVPCSRSFTSITN